MSSIFDLQQTTNIKSLSDQDILSLSLNKPDFFAEIVDRYERAFTRKALSLLGNEEDAYDAVQEAFVRIYAAGGKFRAQEGATFKSWAYKILVNQCYTAYRKSHRGSNVSFDLDPELAEIIPDQSGLDAFESKLTREYALSLISRLPELLRRAVTLHFIEDKPSKEIAELEGISDGAVRARIHRAKEELRKMSVQTF